MKKVHQDLEKSRIGEEGIGNISIQKETLKGDPLEEKPQGTEGVFSVEEKAKVSKRMKESEEKITEEIERTCVIVAHRP